MKIELSLLSTLLLLTTTVLGRMQTQGIEQTLLALALESGITGIRSAVKLLPVARRPGR